MSQTISPQHPAVILRSHYRHLRAMLAIAIVVVVALTTAVVILATDDAGRDISSAQPLSAPAGTESGLRPDGGPEESTRGPFGVPSSSSTR